VIGLATGVGCPLSETVVVTSLAGVRVMRASTLSLAARNPGSATVSVSQCR
jgi:hypothetical protein